METDLIGHVPERIQLPIGRALVVDGIEREVSITLSDLGLALLDAGASYAIVTLCQYLLVGGGMIYAVSSLDLQWLVATLGVGLGFSLQEIVDKDVIRRVLAKHLRPGPGGDGPSWLTAIGHARDSLWSADLFRCESMLLKSHWILVVMDQYTRRIIGFAVHVGDVDGVTLCRMFNRVLSKQPLPRYLSTDHDPLFRFHRWQVNLRALDIEPVKTVPYVPVSHPFVERLIGSVRRELLDQTLIGNSPDLERKLASFRDY